MKTLEMTNRTSIERCIQNGYDIFDDCVRVRRHGNVGVLCNNTGKVLVPCKYQSCMFYSNFILAEYEDSTYDAYSWQGNLIGYKHVDYCDPSKRVMIEGIGRYQAAVTYEGTIVVPIERKIDTIIECKTAVITHKGGKQGVFSFNGRELARPIYDQCILTDLGIIAYQDDEVIVITFKGQEFKGFTKKYRIGFKQIELITKNEQKCIFDGKKVKFLNDK